MCDHVRNACHIDIVVNETSDYCWTTFLGEVGDVQWEPIVLEYSIALEHR